MGTKTFVLIGAAGYIAPKHFEAISQIKGELLAVIDPIENLDILDNYFPEAEYFRSTEEAIPFMNTNKVDYFVVCSPSYLHAEHICFGLSQNCDIICESPMVLTKKELAQIREKEDLTGHTVYNILQYRYDPEILRLKQEFDQEKQYIVDLKNHSYRGKWIQQSWKGDPGKTGGLLTVLGYHFFDALIWIYGQPFSLQIDESSENNISGKIELDHASISFDLCNKSDKIDKENTLFMQVDQQKVVLSTQDKNLFKIAYSDILNQNGWRIEDLKAIIDLLEENI